MKCKLCNKEVKGKKGLAAHMRVHQKRKEKKIREFVLNYCPNCGFPIKELTDAPIN